MKEPLFAILIQEHSLSPVFKLITEELRLIWFLYFLAYSFLGFLLEVVYAHSTGGAHARKCLLVLPLCPVYGVGACAIVWAAPFLVSLPALFLMGAILATVAEYAMAVFYEELLGVSFWDYSALPFHLHGRVCLVFSLAWGFLSLPLVWWVHPALTRFLSAVPPPVSWCLLLTFWADSIVTAFLLRSTGTKDSLAWYQPKS